MTTIAENTFAAACYEQNSVEELQSALEGAADVGEMMRWGLTSQEWREQIALAIAALKDEE